VNLGQQTLALLRIAENYRADHCRELLAKASGDACAILRTAHRAARRDLRAALSSEREKLARELAAAEARLVTERRLREQRRVAAILRQAWPRLTQALRERWGTPAGRAAWVEHHLAIAVAALPAEGWVIRHPENWPTAEREQASQWLRSKTKAGARFEADPGLPAGIRVVCGMNVLDA
jgi:hypothetical protein